MIEVAADSASRRIRLTEEEIDRFREDYRRASASLPLSQSYDLLVEVHGSVQSQDIVAALQEAARTAQRKAQHIAIVCHGQLLAQQLKRIAGDERDMAFFEEAAQAQRWLRQR